MMFAHHRRIALLYIEVFEEIRWKLDAIMLVRVLHHEILEICTTISDERKGGCRRV